MNSSEINDVRMPNEFKSESFSRYKKTAVRDQLLSNMCKGKIEPACYWSAELICAGQYQDLWEIILHYTGKHIHLGNPKMVSYLEMRYQIFRNIMTNAIYTNELQLRNNQNIRELFAEIIAVLTFSTRKHSFEAIKINRIEEFDITQMSDRLKATSVQFAEPIFRKKDPKEIYIPINEFCYHISCDKKSMLQACYWIEWIIEFDIICRKKKEVCGCEKRNEYSVENKYQRDIIWLIWDGLLHYVEKIENPFINRVLKSILNLFCIKYTCGSSKKRRYLLYFAVALLTEHIPVDIELIQNKDQIKYVVEKINEIYKQIKKNEESPNTEYLFSNMEQQNQMETSMKKMDMVNSLDILTK
jgi:hypothetical protein